MDADCRDLVPHLFALATEIAEGAHETGTLGQASSMHIADLTRTADALDRHARDLRAIARAIAVAAKIDRTEFSPEKPS